MKLKTILDTVTKLKDHIPAPASRSASTAGTKRKRRKTDIRTIRKQKRLSVAKWKREHGDLARELAGSLRWQYFHLRREVKRRFRNNPESNLGEWELSLPEWVLMWSSVPAIEVGKNVFVPAYKLRGRKKEDVQLRRIDKNKPWEINNIEVVRNGQVLYGPDIAGGT